MGKTGCVLGAGEDENGCRQGQTDAKSRCLNQCEHHNHTTHVKRKPAETQCFCRFCGRGRRTRTLGTRFWSGCVEVQQGAGKSRCCPVPAASKKRCGAGLVLGGNYPSQNRRKRAKNPRKSRKHIDLNRQRPYKKMPGLLPAGVCCRQAVSHSLLLNAERG